MHRTAATWSEFQSLWDRPQNFLMASECVPFAFDMPPLERVVEELRQDPGANIHPGQKGRKLDMRNAAEEFRKLPIDRALESTFSLAHYKLGGFDAPGRFLHGFKHRVLDPWEAALAANGYTWTRCYPIIFISGRGCATNYHMDYSHVVAWQVYGAKRFCGLKDPARWAPREARLNYNAATCEMPAELKDDDALVYEMKPGNVLWNALLTPHWVDAGNEVAMSVNISHGGLRLHDKLCPFETELEADRLAKGMKANPVGGTY